MNNIAQFNTTNVKCQILPMPNEYIIGYLEFDIGHLALTSLPHGICQ